MFKIGEFSKLGQVSTRMLRHYDQLGLLRPSQTDKFTGYRYYTIDQLSRLNRIIALKELGLPLEQIAQLLGQDGAISAERLRGMLAMRQAQIEQELRDKQWQIVEVEARLRQIELEGQTAPYEVVVKPAPAQAVASLRQTVPRLDEMGYYCLTLYHRLYAELAQAGITPLQPEITLYHNEEYTETDLEVETAVAISPRHLQQPERAAACALRELPAADRVAALIYEGPFAEMTAAILALLQYVGLHRHMPAGPLRELHLSGPAHDGQGRAHPAPVVELQIPIQPLAAYNHGNTTPRR